MVTSHRPSPHGGTDHELHRLLVVVAKVKAATPMTTYAQ